MVRNTGRDKILAGSRRDRGGLSGRIKSSCAGRARQRNAVASGKHLVLYAGDCDVVRAPGSFSGCPRRRAGADRNRRILFATAQAGLRGNRSRSRSVGRRQEVKTVCGGRRVACKSSTHRSRHGCLYRKWCKQEVNVLTREAAARHGKSSLLLPRTHDRNYFYSTVRQGHNQRNPPPCQR